MSKVVKQNSTNENPGEMYFTWYLDELKAHGYLKWWDREPETLRVMDDYKYLRERQYKSKENVLEPFKLLSGFNYTYDYRLVWEEKALNIFTEIMEPATKDAYFKFGLPSFISHEVNLMDALEIVSYVDVKPPAAVLRFAGNVSSAYTFPFIQKILLWQYGMYINKIVPTNSGNHSVSTNLFAQTFTPNRFMFTDTGKQTRKIPYMVKSIKSYTTKRRAAVDAIIAQDREKSLKNSQATLL